MLSPETEVAPVSTNFGIDSVEHGTVRNRADVVAALQEAGLEVLR